MKMTLNKLGLFNNSHNGMDSTKIAYHSILFHQPIQEKILKCSFDIYFNSVLIEGKSLSVFELKFEISPQSNLLDLRSRNCVPKMRLNFYK